MGTPTIKLILTDIDGTILPFGESVVPERTRDAFHAAMDAGIHIGPASGRDISHVAPAFGGDDACVATALATNGMQVFLDGELICEKYIEHWGLEELQRVAAGQEGCGLIVFNEEGVPLLIEGKREILAKSFPVYAATAVDGVLPGTPVVKANIFVDGDWDETARMLDVFEREIPGLDFNLPVQGFLNVIPKGWSKASGIDVLCEALSIGIDEVVVFGDSGNDLEMLEHVPHSAAVSSGTEQARAAATHIIGACNDGAVADAIFALADGAWPFER